MQTAERDSTRWSLLPGGVISVCIHVVLLVAASISLRGCERNAPADAGGQAFREIGLALVPDTSEPSADEHSSNPQDGTAESPSENDQQVDVQQALPTEIPDVAALLGNHGNADPGENSAESRRHPGHHRARYADCESAVRSGRHSGADSAAPDRGQGAGGSLTPGPGETSFMNIVGNGDSFVYLIDTSSSMGSGGRLDLARSQLKSSLRLLQPHQRFQVLFYNESTTAMKLRNRAEQNLYAATAVQVQLAEQEINRVTATSGTEHLQPILHALRLEPDVLYFLTDGDQPRLSRSELQTVRTHNRHGAQIHVIEFASGAKETREVSWLQLLASQSGGKYLYIPVR